MSRYQTNIELTERYYFDVNKLSFLISTNIEFKEFKADLGNLRGLKFFVKEFMQKTGQTIIPVDKVIS